MGTVFPVLRREDPTVLAQAEVRPDPGPAFGFSRDCVSIQALGVG